MKKQSIRVDSDGPGCPVSSMRGFSTSGPWEVGNIMQYQVSADGKDAIPFDCYNIDAKTGEAIGMAACETIAKR